MLLYRSNLVIMLRPVTIGLVIFGMSRVLCYGVAREHAIRELVVQYPEDPMVTEDERRH
ncbi:MAG: hypothetical protein M3305_16400 [Actinomycetota bacterium]|nr:hypothetical protein [Actinomycetota bacterium]